MGPKNPLCMASLECRHVHTKRSIGCGFLYFPLSNREPAKGKNTVLEQEEMFWFPAPKIHGFDFNLLFLCMPPNLFLNDVAPLGDVQAVQELEGS